MSRFTSFRFFLLVLVLPLLAACGVIPADPDGTLERIRGDVMRVGISSASPWTVFEDGEASGIEVELLEAFAEEQNAEIEWFPGGEEQLIGELEAENLDIVIGGLTDQSPWSSSAALTRPFREVQNDRRETEKHVMAVRRGENALLFALDKFLQEEADQP